SDEFEKRQMASRELGKQGQAVEPALRKALAATASPEVRLRIRALLDRLPRINLAVLEVPAGLKAVGPDELVARCTRGLRSKDSVVRGVAAGRLASLEPERKKAVEGLVRVLRQDRHEYVRRCVAGALQREGWQARPALAELRAALSEPDVNIRNA